MQLVRDAERLNATEVALLPVTLMQLYENRSAKEQQAVTTHLFFDGIAKPWALEPAKLDAEVCHQFPIAVPDCTVLHVAMPTCNVSFTIQLVHCGIAYDHINPP